MTLNKTEGRAETTFKSIRPVPRGYPRRVYGVGMCDPHQYLCYGDECLFAHGRLRDAGDVHIMLPVFVGYLFVLFGIQMTAYVRNFLLAGILQVMAKWDPRA